MAKICKSCDQSYADNLAVCPYCASSVEVVFKEPPKPPSGASIEIVLDDANKPQGGGKKPLGQGPQRVLTGSESDIEIDLGKLPQPAPGVSDSATSNVNWSALVSSSSDSGVDLAAGGLTIDSPSDVGILGPKAPSGRRETEDSWTEIGLEDAESDPGILVEGGSGVVVEGGGGIAGLTPLGPGSGSDDDIDLARLEAESRAKAKGMPEDGSGVVIEGAVPASPTKPAPVESGSASEIDLGALVRESEESTPSQFAERLLLDDGSEIELGRPKKPEKGPSDLDLVPEELGSGVNLAGRARQPTPLPGDSGVDLAALFEEEPSAGSKGQGRSADTSAVDLGALLPNQDEPAAKGWKTPASSGVRLGGGDRGEASDVKLAGSDVQLAGSGLGLSGSDVGLAGSSGKLGESEVRLGGSDVGLAGSGREPRSSDVQLAGSDVGLAGSSGDLRGSDVQLAGSDVGLAGSSGRLGGSDVQLAGSDVGLAGSSSGRQATRPAPLVEEDFGVVETGDELGLAEDEDRPPPRTTVPVEKAAAGMSPVVGGIIGAVLSTAACIGLYFSGLLPGNESAGRPATPGASETQIRELQARAAQLETAANESREESERLSTQIAAARAEAAKTATERKEALSKAEAVRKQAEARAEKASQEAAATREQLATLNMQLAEAKKVADPKVLEQLKKDREAATLKVAELEKLQKAAELKVVEIEKERKGAEQKATELLAELKQAQGLAGKTAQQAELVRKQMAALTTALEEAKKAADPKALELLKKDREAATQKIAELEKDRKAAELKVVELEKERKAADQKVVELQASLKQARASGDAALQRLLETTRAEAEKAKKDVTAAQRAAEMAQATVKTLKDLLAKNAPGQRIDFPAEAVDPLEAEEQYAAGVRSFADGNYPEAERAFFEAARHGGQDARYLYYLGLARYAQGKREIAEADFREAARLERQSKPARAAVTAALERIQGRARQVLEQYR